MISVLIAATAVSSGCFVRQQVYAQPVVQQVYAVPVVNYWYGVGQNVQLSALVTKQLRSDSEYQQFLAWKRQKAQQSQYQQQTPPPMPEGQDQAELPPPDPVPSQPSPTPPTPGPVAPAPQPAAPVTVSAICARCHGGATPKGQFFLDGQAPIDELSLSKAVQKVMLGEMPPPVDPDTHEPIVDHVPLTALQKFQIIEDLIQLKLLGEGN